MLKCLEECRKDSSTSATFIQIIERKLKKAEMAVVETEEIVEEIKKQIEEVKTSLENKKKQKANNLVTPSNKNGKTTSNQPKSSTAVVTEIPVSVISEQL